MQKAHELICWWHVSGRVTRRHLLAATLHASYAGEADEPSAAGLRFLRSEGFMLAACGPNQASAHMRCLARRPMRWCPGGVRVNPRLCMPGPVRTRNYSA